MQLKKILIAGIILTAFGCCFSIPVTAQTLSFEEVFTIGKIESDSTEYLFSGPKEITSDNLGRVFIADGSSNTIRIFDQQGRYLDSVGRRGRGPGEFLSIDHLIIDDDNNLYVLDRLSRRVSIFPASLSDQETYSIEAHFTDPFALYPLSSGDYLVFAPSASNLSDNQELAYLFGDEFRELKDNFLPVYPTIFESKEPFFNALSISPFYNSALFGDDQIALTHENFSGKITVVNLDNKTKPFYSLGEWNRENFNILDWNKRAQYRNRNMIGLETTSVGGGFAFQTTASKGLVGNKNYLLHFYAPLKDNLRISKVTIYDKNGTELVTQELNDTELNFYKENGRIGLIPKHMDDQNQIYFADYTRGMGFPVVRVVKMEVE